ncbi:hypothetical protein D4764_03G0003420 [Takifugu flavidus]|uniref:Uncharacterized protein n=1 Tax=Takifugu flavidus TaxID=433684 RepID=A0A5C6N752_9TELE|nr:hypothetical protein D4764_03G0003420 [Takifugu flavidus]
MSKSDSVERRDCPLCPRSPQMGSRDSCRASLQSSWPSTSSRQARAPPTTSAGVVSDDPLTSALLEKDASIANMCSSIRAHTEAGGQKNPGERVWTRKATVNPPVTLSSRDLVCRCDTLPEGPPSLRHSSSLSFPAEGSDEPPEASQKQLSGPREPS